MQAGLNSFTLTPKQWIERTGAVGLTSKPGRYGGTYAHKDVAFEFATWISMEFKLYLLKEFQRLKTEKASRESREWSVVLNPIKVYGRQVNTVAGRLSCRRHQDTPRLKGDVTLSRVHVNRRRSSATLSSRGSPPRGRRAPMTCR